MKQRKGPPQTREVCRDEVSIAGEADYIAARAVVGDARVVSLGALVFFSTAAGDASVLDAEDNLVLQLAAAGTRLSFAITETREGLPANGRVPSKSRAT